MDKVERKNTIAYNNEKIKANKLLIQKLEDENATLNHELVKLTQHRDLFNKLLRVLDDEEKEYVSKIIKTYIANWRSEIKDRKELEEEVFSVENYTWLQYALEVWNDWEDDIWGWVKENFIGWDIVKEEWEELMKEDLGVAEIFKYPVCSEMKENFKSLSLMDKQQLYTIMKMYKVKEGVKSIQEIDLQGISWIELLEIIQDEYWYEVFEDESWKGGIIYWALDNWEEELSKEEWDNIKKEDEELKELLGL